MNFGVYELRGEQFPVAEIEEIAVASNTMSYDDYLDCRDLSLTIETFNNNGIFYDLMQMLVSRGIERGDLIMAIYDNVKKDSGEISKLYQQFREEEKRNLWDSEEELAEYLKQPGIIDKYVLGEFGTNEIYKYRMLSTFYNIEEMHDIIYASALSLLQERGTLSEDLELYLEDLKRFSILRKRQLFDTDKAFTETFNFDFIALGNKNYAGDPLQYYRPDGIEIEIFHTEWQRDLISGYTNQFGTTIIGLGRILNRAHIAQMYRASKRVGTDVIVAPDLKRVSVDAL